MLTPVRRMLFRNGQCNRYKRLSNVFNVFPIYSFSSNSESTTNGKWTDIYYVTRIDDNGHSFKIKSFKTQDEANKYLKWMERTKHKQTYIIETTPSEFKK
eukprot:681250_1